MLDRLSVSEWAVADRYDLPLSFSQLTQHHKCPSRFPCGILYRVPAICIGSLVLYRTARCSRRGNINFFPCLLFPTCTLFSPLPSLKVSLVAVRREKLLPRIGVSLAQSFD